MEENKDKNKEEIKPDVKTEEKTKISNDQKILIAKRISIVLAVIIICVLIYVIVIAVYSNNANKETETQNTAISEENTVKDEVITDEALYTLENYPKVDASTATQPLANAFIKNFTQTETIDEDTLGYTKTHQAYEKLINDQVDLILVTEPSADELKMASDAGIELEVIPVVKEGFVFYVNSNNPVNSLTQEQIQQIYSGEITNWSAVGGEDSEIKAYQRPVNSGSQTGMLSLVMKDKQLMSAPTENIAGTMYDIINFVSSYDNGKNSIGYSYYYYATTMFKTIDENVASNIKLLAIDNVEPKIKTIQNGTYPYTTAYYIVLNKADGEDSASRILANQMLSARGQQVAEDAGYVPVKEK